MLIKNNNWELGAYLLKQTNYYFPGVNIDYPIKILSNSFVRQCQIYYINEKFFYYHPVYELYMLKTNVEVIFRFFIRLKTDRDNIINTFIGSTDDWNFPELISRGIFDLKVDTNGGIYYDYKTGIYDSNMPKEIALKNETFAFGCNEPDNITLDNNLYGFYWSILLKQI